MRTLRNIIKPIIFTIAVLFSTATVLANNPLTDADISRAVEDELMLNTTTPSYMIDVTTYDGIVTLSGSVDNLLAKDRAAQIAKAVKGVRGVVNKIEIDTPVISDEKLEKEVNDALLNDPATDSYEISVEVDNGIANLRGIVDSYQEKQLSEFVTKGVEGLLGVENQIDVEYKTERTDYEIRQDIEGMLKNDKRIDDALINVSVNDGEVTLSGVVGSASEKSNAALTAWTAGVTGVNDEGLEVKEWARDEELRKDKYVERSDSEIKEAVKDALLFDPRVYSFNPEVDVQYGIVTLSGEVDNLKAKMAAEQDAKNVVGVVRVKNYMKVEPAYIPKDDELEADIEMSLIKDPVLENWEVDVTADNGIVYLNGNVDSYFEKIQAEDIAARTKGVVAVKNNINVNNLNDHVYQNYYGWNTWYPYYQVEVNDYYNSDTEIKNNIESQLWWSPYVNEDEVAVMVDDGVATLEGLVDTEREKLFAEINALEGGATDVDNNLIVE